MLEHSIYSVISPEGCASILWKDAEKMREAAEALRLTAQDLHKLGVCDLVIKEPLGGAQRERDATIAEVGKAIRSMLAQLKDRKGADLSRRAAASSSTWARRVSRPDPILADVFAFVGNPWMPRRIVSFETARRIVRGRIALKARAQIRRFFYNKALGAVALVNRLLPACGTPNDCPICPGFAILPSTAAFFAVKSFWCLYELL
jgi:hypothetical protein